MEPVRPSNGPATGPAAPQAVAKVLPVGRGWMLLAVDAGFVLRSAAQGLDVSLTREDAEALRRGEVTPEALAARTGHVHQPPPGAVTVAFSAEAMRLSGQMGAGKGSGKAGVPPGKAKAPVPLPPLPVGWIGAGLSAVAGLRGSC